MAFAPHTNTDVFNARLMDHGVPALLLGSFTEKETGGYFEYGVRGNAHGSDFAPEFDEVIYTTDGTRLAKVLKTVVYVVIDEDADSQPVVEKWTIKGRNEYDLEWMGVNQ